MTKDKPYRNTLYDWMESFKGTVPRSARALMRSFFHLQDYDRYRRERSNPFLYGPQEYHIPGSPCKLGIIQCPLHYHKHYIAACRELGISYVLIDLTHSNWIEAVKTAQCDAFLVWPASSPTYFKDLFDDRLRIMAESMACILYPTVNEIWFYENKRRQYYWLAAQELPHPMTWIFYNSEEALEFLRHSDYPLIFKTNIGSSSKGVRILRNFNESRKIVDKCFKKGISLPRSDPYDRQRGSIYLQEFLPVVREWRMVRIGQSYFGHPKGRRGQFHSGSGLVEWDLPDLSLLELVKKVTDMGGFRSMNLDVFESRNRLYINELHTVFGTSVSVDQMRFSGKPGRYVYESSKGWIFQPGDFARNACCNLRVLDLVQEVLSIRVQHFGSAD